MQRKCEKDSKGKSGRRSDEQQNGQRHNDAGEKYVRGHWIPVLNDHDCYQDRQDRRGDELKVAHNRGQFVRAIHLSNTPALESGDRRAFGDIRINNELKHPDLIELDGVIFDLAG